MLRSSEFLYKKCLLPCFKFWGIWKFRVESNWDAVGEREKKRGNAFACTQSVDIYLGLTSQLITCYKWRKTIKQWRTRSKYHISASALSKALSSMLCFLSCLVLSLKSMLLQLYCAPSTATKKCLRIHWNHAGLSAGLWAACTKDHKRDKPSLRTAFISPHTPGQDLGNTTLSVCCSQS